MKSEPPLGIAILSILYWIRGILGILAGLVVLSIGALAAAAITDIDPELGADTGAVVFLVFALLAFAIIGLGVLICAVGRGLWQLKSWAWWVALILSTLSVVGSLVHIAVASQLSLSPFLALPDLVIDGIVVVYLLTPGVREAFGIGAPRAAPVRYRAVYPRCSNPSCGAEMRPGWKYCPRCLIPSGSQAVSPSVRHCTNPACRRSVEPGWSYCPYCLAAVATTW